jgi:hypothetical protein
MPLYKTSNGSGKTIGVYNAQRPSIAASKAFTSLRRQEKDLLNAEIFVQTEGKKITQSFQVEYKQIQDDFLGLVFRPIATKTVDAKE